MIKKEEEKKRWRGRAKFSVIKRVEREESESKISNMMKR